MRGKQKILDALDCVIDDLSEDRLIDLLVDAYESKKRRIIELTSENAREREQLHQDREQIHKEMRLMRTDPLYAPAGEYFFKVPGTKTKFGVRIHGLRIEGYSGTEGGNFIIAAQQIPRWED